MATKILSDDTVFSNIATAIRNKLGTTGTIRVSNMAAAINSIPTGSVGKTPALIDGTVTSLSSADFGTATTIKQYAFYGCNYLDSAMMSDAITTIGANAFYNCQFLRLIHMSNQVQSIGSYAFYGCSTLAEVSFPYTLNELGASAFYNCSGLTNIEFAAGLTAIQERTFYGACIAASAGTDHAITLPSTVRTIGNQAFALGSSSLKDYGILTVSCAATQPPALGTEVFKYRTVTVHVPAGTAESYQAAWINPGTGATMTYIDDL